jgi:hypothetical protein
MFEEQYPALWRSFGLNKKFGSRFFKTYENRPLYLEELNQWFMDLQKLPIRGIQKKIAEANSVFHWESIKAELKFAQFFANHKITVELVSGKMEKVSQTPDMILIETGDRVFVEVKRVTQDESKEKVYSVIDEILGATERHHIVTIQFGKGITQVGLDVDSRNRIIGYVDSVISDFTERYSPNLGQTTLELKHAIVNLFPVQAGLGHIGLIWGMPYTGPNPEIRKKIKRDLIDKSRKASSWDDSHYSVPFLIGLYCDHRMIHGWDIGPVFGWRNSNEDIFLESKLLNRVSGVLVWLVSLSHPEKPLYFQNRYCTVNQLPSSFDFLKDYQVLNLKDLWDS